MAIYHRAKKQSFLYGDKNEFYWLLGDTKNPPILVIPGLTGTHSRLLEFCQDLKQNFFLILPDLPGWGDSPRFKEVLTLSNYSKYLRALLDNLKIKKVNLVGHCLGAVICVEFSYLYPELVNKLILISLPYEDGQKSYSIIKYLTSIGNRLPYFLRHLLYFWENRYFNLIFSFILIQFKSKREKIHWALEGFRNQANQDWSIFEETWFDLMHFDYEKIQKIELPTYLLFGEKDLLISKKQVFKLHALIPQATLDFIENAGHVSPVETPDTLARLAKKYLLD